MKGIKAGFTFNGKLNGNDDLPWKIFGFLLKDLGFNEGNAKQYFGAIRNRDYKRLMSLLPAVSPRSMIDSNDTPTKADAFEFFRRYQLGAYLKKFPFKGTDTKSPAIEKFYEGEAQCKLFNEQNFKALVSLDERHPEFFGILDDIRSDIEDVLGTIPDIESIIGHAKHGPGVSLGDQYQGGCSTSFYKWASLPYSVTQGTKGLARHAIESDPRWVGALDDWYRSKFKLSIGIPIDVDLFWSHVLEVVDGSRITTVPKTAETDRTIAIEPLLNVYLQLGVDHVIKSALRRKWGYDLTSQEENQKMAYEGSVTDELVTVDMRNASETVALILCYLLLPPAWMDLLMDLRSPQGSFFDSDGNVQDVIHFEKISSMGNGFTFALESLIFGSLVRAAIRRTKSVKKSAVYGDDLIVPTTAYPFLKTLLNLCGFKLNEEKSFADGPFRESCGKDFYLGYDVRPVFLKRNFQDVRDLFYAHNSLWLLQERLHWTWSVDLSRTLKFIRSQLSTQVEKLIYGPPGEALDTHLFSERKILKDPEGKRFFWQLIAKPVVFKTRGKDYFFRKLMASLRPRNRVLTVIVPDTVYKWTKRQRMDTGNAFEVTRRDATVVRCEKQYLVESGCCVQKPLPAWSKCKFGRP